MADTRSNGGSSYKAEKEAFVSGMAGSSITHVLLVSLVALVAVSLHAALTTRISIFSSHRSSHSGTSSPLSRLSKRSRSNSPHTSNSTTPPRRRRHPTGPGLLTSYLTLVLPLLLSMTLFASPSSFVSFFFSTTSQDSSETIPVSTDGDWALWPPLLLSAILCVPTVAILLLKERVDIRMRGALPLRSPVRPTRVTSQPSGISSALGAASGLDERISRTSSRLGDADAFPPQTGSTETTDKTARTDVTSNAKAKIRPLPALTTYRAHMMLMTVLAILAVDFRVFPRALAKCESWGVGLMDLGVGSFVFSQGLVSARFLLLEPLSFTSSHKNSLDSFLKSTTRALRKSLPLIILGVARLVLVKASDYPEHVAEYGVHWNFFLTLAVVAVGQVVVISGVRLVVGGVTRKKSVVGPGPMLLGSLVALVQFFLLYPNFFAFESYVLSDTPRTTLLLGASLRQIINSNREGLVSLPGYLAIHLLGMAAGAIVLPPTPGVYRKGVKVLQVLDSARTQEGNDTKDSENKSAEKAQKAVEEYKRALGAPRELDKTATELSGQAIIWWSCLGAASLLGLDPEGMSRRLVNLSYILWVAAFNTTFLLAYIVVLDMGIYATPKSSVYDNPYIERTPEAVKKHRSQGNDARGPVDSVATEDKDAETPNPPRLLAAINHHGLSVFLLANVLTGLVNLSIHSTRVGNVAAMGVLIGYSFVLSATAWALY